MARLNSFYLAPESWPEPGSGRPFVLDGPEARHLLKVLRAAPGDELRLFDGQGRDGRFVLERGQGGRALLAVRAISLHPESPHGLVLALGWNKSSRRDWLLEKSVELGLSGLAFWQAERSQGHLPEEPKDTWRAKQIQAAKQCGALRLPKLSLLPGGVDALIGFARGFEQCYLFWEAAPAQAVPRPEDLGTGAVLAVLGPEGGLEPNEAGRLTAAGFRAASLGPSILRWETAALLCMGLAHLGRGRTP